MLHNELITEHPCDVDPHSAEDVANITIGLKVSVSVIIQKVGPYLLVLGGDGMTSLGKNARVAGLIYLVGSLVAIVRLVYIPNTLISDNATATVSNIATHECCSDSAFSPNESLGCCGSLLLLLFIVCLRRWTRALLC